MILVTQASGRTGRSVVGALGPAGLEVRAFDIADDVEQLVGEQGATQAVVGDLLNVDDVRRAVDGVDSVVHVGPPMHPWKAEMGHAVVSAARVADVEHFVQFSPRTTIQSPTLASTAAPFVPSHHGPDAA